MNFYVKGSRAVREAALELLKNNGYDVTVIDPNEYIIDNMTCCMECLDDYNFDLLSEMELDDLQKYVIGEWSYRDFSDEDYYINETIQEWVSMHAQYIYEEE